MAQVAEWLHDHEVDKTLIEAANVWLYYYMELDPEHPQKLWMPHSKLEDLAAGTVVVWDIHYSDRVGYTLEALSNGQQWELLKDFDRAKVFLRK